MKALFPDTNIFMHFRQIDEIDWTSLAATAQTDLVIAPVVYRQLDRYKDRKSERMRTALSKIRSIARSGGDVRANVKLVFLHEDPLIDYASHRLDRQSEDDQLIASMVQYREERGDVEVILVSDDFLLEQKAKAHLLAVLCPDDSLRLSAEISPEEKELKQLRDENRHLTSRQSRLVLRFASGERHREVILTPHRGWGEGVRERRLHEMKALYPSNSGWALDHIRIARGDYYQECEDYLDSLDKYECLQAQGAEISFDLINEGRGSATDIDLTLSAATPVQVYESESWDMQPPKAPSPSALALGIEPRIMASAFPSLIEEPVTVSISNQEAGFEIHAKVRKLKARMTQELGPFRIFFPSADCIRSFKMTYLINAEGLPENLTGELHIVAKVGV